MNLHLYQYGRCSNLPGISIGIAREIPRGVRVEDRLREGYFQTWMPLLAPSRELYKAYRSDKITYQEFARRYRREMKAPEPKQTISLLAALCQTVRINLGCFCENESRCHRSQLAQLIEKAALDLPPLSEAPRQFYSPPCSMPEIED